MKEDLLLIGKDVTYEVQRNKLDMQKIVSGVPKDEQGMIVLLQSITDHKKAEKVAFTLAAHDVHHESDLHILLAKLDCRLLLTFKDEIIEKAFS